MGPDWGITSTNDEQGLDCLIEEELNTKKGDTGPLNTKEGREVGRNTKKEEAGPLNAKKGLVGVSITKPAENKASGGTSTIDDAITGPLLGDNSAKEVDRNEGSMKDEVRSDASSPLIEYGNTNELNNGLNSEASTGPLSSEHEGLYEGASNVATMREARKDCIVRKMHCIVHNQEARKYTTKTRVWTLIKKTGLYAYRTRKLSVMRCDGHMENLVGTMDRLDGVGDSTNSTQASE